MTAMEPCRLCLNPKTEAIDIFSHSYPEDVRQTIVLSIEKIFSFTIQPSERLRHICTNCIGLLKEFSDFFNLVIASQAFLSEWASDYKGTYKHNAPVIKQNDIFIEKHPTNLKEDNNASPNICVIATPVISKIKVRKLRSILKSNNPVETDLQCVDKDDIKIKSEINDDACLHSDRSSIESIIHQSNINKEKTKRKSYTFPNIQILSKDSKSINVEHSTNESKELNSNLKLHLTVRQSKKKRKVVRPEKLIENGNLTLRGPLLEDMIRKFYKIHCEICLNKPIFECLSDMFKHYASEHKTKGFITCCDSRCYSRKSIISHMARHIQNDAFRCPICKKELLSKASLKSHILNHLPEAERPFKCNICKRGFSSSSLLIGHKELHLPVEKRRNYKCKYCDKLFISASTCHYHMSTVHTGGNYLCSECGRNFANKTTLMLHLQTHDKSGSTNVQCKQCGAVLKNKQNLKRHLKKHSEERIQCKLCDFSTHRNTLLKSHMAVRHTDSKPFECKLCDAKFKTKQGLKSHMVQHTGEKKYSCPYCPKTFASSGNCYSHQKRMHLELYKKYIKKKQEQRLESINLLKQKAKQISDEKQIDIQSVQEEIKKLDSKTECIYARLDLENNLG